RRAGEIIETTPDTIIQKEDVIAVMTHAEALARGTTIGPEVNDKALLDFPAEVLDVVITNKALVGTSLAELAQIEAAHGVFLRKIVRLGEPMPYTRQTRVDRGDVLNLIGAKPDVERAAKALGYADRPTVTTDMIFIGVVGLGAGPSFVSGLQKSGPSLIFVGLLVATLPHVLAIVFGRYVLKMNPLILLGACSGAGTVTAALRALQEESQSKLPALGYTVPYALGNILLTAWGPVIVALMH